MRPKIRDLQKLLNTEMVKCRTFRLSSVCLSDIWYFRIVIKLGHVQEGNPKCRHYTKPCKYVKLSVTFLTIKTVILPARDMSQLHHSWSFLVFIVSIFSSTMQAWGHTLLRTFVMIFVVKKTKLKLLVSREIKLWFRFFIITVILQNWGTKAVVHFCHHTLLTVEGL